MTSVDEIEQYIKPFLLRTVEFSLDGRQLKQGKLQLFCIKDFFCVFTLINQDKNNKKVIYEVPYPFNIRDTGSSLELDYTIESFCMSNKAIKESVTAIRCQKISKLFNKKLIVNAID
jgi:hypothetical protein